MEKLDDGPQPETTSPRDLVQVCPDVTLVDDLVLRLLHLDLIPVFRALVTQWESTTQHRELVFRATERNVGARYSPSTEAAAHSTKLAFPDVSMATERWDLQSLSCDVHIRESFELNNSKLRDSPSDDKAIVVDASFGPRRSGGVSWSICLSLMIRRYVVMKAKDRSMRMPVRLQDQDGRHVGSATLLLFRSRSDLSVDSPLEHGRVPVQVHLTFSQLELRSQRRADSLTIVVEVTMTGQSNPQAFRSQPLEICSEKPFPPVGIPLLRMEDCSTQLVCLTVYRYHPKERPHRIAEGFVVVNPPSIGGEKSYHVTKVSLDVVSRRSAIEESQTGKWGELAVTVHAQQVTEDERTCDKEVATIPHTDSPHLAEVEDIDGSLDIVLDKLTLLDQRQAKATCALKLQMEVLPVKWSKTLMVKDRPSRTNEVDLKREYFRAPLKWSTKERSVPAFRCCLEIEEATSASLQMISSSLIPPGEGSTDTSWKTKRPIYTNDLHLTMLLAYPDEWMSAELVFVSGNRDAVAKLRLLVRAAPTSSRPVSLIQVQFPFHVAGYILMSRLRVSGAFMKGHQPNCAYKLQLTCGNASVSSAPSSNGTASEIAWSAAMSCPLASAAPPLVQLTVLKVKPPSLVSASRSLEDENAVVASLCVPLPAIVMNENHLVSFSLPLALSSDTPTRAKKVGTIRFDLQHLPSQESKPDLDHSSTLDLLRVRLVPGTHLMDALLDEKFNLKCEVSLVVGDSLSTVLSTRSVSRLHHHRVASTANEFALDCSVAIDKNSIDRIEQAALKAAVIVKLINSDGEKLLGQCVMAMRGAWNLFAQTLVDKWHKLYAPTRDRVGNLETIGEIQMSASVRNEGNEFEESTQSAEGWVLLEVLEAVLTSATELDSAEAFVQLEHESRGKTEKASKKQGTNGHWRWENEAVFVLPDYAMAEKAASLQYRLTFGAYGSKEVEVVNPSEFPSLVERICLEMAAVQVNEEWLIASVKEPSDLKVRIRLRYVPAITGTLQLTVAHALNVCSPSIASTFRSVPIDRLRLCCSSAVAVKVSSSVLKPTEAGIEFWQQLHYLNEEKLDIEVNTCAPWKGIPTLKIQILGVSSSLVQEVCFGIGSLDITDLISGSCNTSRGIRSQWINLFAKRNPSVRVAAALVRLEFIAAASQPTNCPPAIVPSHDVWAHVCSVVLTLWKKLFYLLDSDRGGSIDLDEFSELFHRHADVFHQTQDGKWLLRVLVGGTDDDSDHAIAQLSTVENVRHTFNSIDTDGDGVIQWSEFVTFIQKRLSLMEPTTSPSTPSTAVSHPPQASTHLQNTNSRELRKKRLEDPLAPNTRCGDMTQRFSLRQLRGLPRAPCSAKTTSGSNDSDVLREENAQMSAKLVTTQALLNIEQQKSARLQAEMRELQATMQHLQMQREREMLESQTKEKMMQEAIREHERTLRERERLRARYNTASIVLQSKVRSRLEQKKFQALKMLRWNSAVRIQSAYRSYIARKALDVLREQSRLHKQRELTARHIQSFLRFHVHRKDRAMLRHARHLSATIIQKHARRMVAVSFRERSVKAALTVQCWQRQRLAKQTAARIDWARRCLSHWMKRWLHRRRWLRVRGAARHLQKWWRRTNGQLCVYLERVEAAMCIQAVWRGTLVRRNWMLTDRDMNDRLTVKSPMIATHASSRMRSDAENPGGEIEINPVSLPGELRADTVINASGLTVVQHSNGMSRDDNRFSYATDASRLLDEDCARLTVDSISESSTTPDKGEYQSQVVEIDRGDESLPPHEFLEEEEDGDSGSFIQILQATNVANEESNEALVDVLPPLQLPSSIDVTMENQEPTDQETEIAELMEVLGEIVSAVSGRGHQVELGSPSPGSCVSNEQTKTIGTEPFDEPEDCYKSTLSTQVIRQESTDATDITSYTTASPSLFDETESVAISTTCLDASDWDGKTTTDLTEDRGDCDHDTGVQAALPTVQQIDVPQEDSKSECSVACSQLPDANESPVDPRGMLEDATVECNCGPIPGFEPGNRSDASDCRPLREAYREEDSSWNLEFKYGEKRLRESHGELEVDWISASETLQSCEQTTTIPDVSTQSLLPRNREVHGEPSAPELRTFTPSIQDGSMTVVNDYIPLQSSDLPAASISEHPTEALMADLFVLDEGELGADDEGAVVIDREDEDPSIGGSRDASDASDDRMMLDADAVTRFGEITTIDGSESAHSPIKTEPLSQDLQAEEQPTTQSASDALVVDLD